MTAEEFKQAVQEIIDPGLSRPYGSRKTWKADPEAGHFDYDKLLERVLRELGYGDGIDLVEELPRWYA